MPVRSQKSRTCPPKLVPGRAPGQPKILGEAPNVRNEMLGKVTKLQVSILNRLGMAYEKPPGGGLNRSPGQE